MAKRTIRTTRDTRGVATVTLDRPEVHNAFNEILVGELTAALTDLAADESVRAVVLTGAGRSFCAGADLDWMRRTGAYSREENLEDARRAAEMLCLLDTLPKPTVASVNGAAYGGGVGLIACCDVAVASESAQFSFSEVRLGLIPAVISPYVIAAIGARQARRYFLTAERFGSAEARRIGLVQEVAAPESLGDAVEDIVSKLLEGGPASIRAAKELIAIVAGRLGDDGLPDETARAIAEVRAREEARQGIRAFLEKDSPPWRSKPPDA